MIIDGLDNLDVLQILNSDRLFFKVLHSAKAIATLLGKGAFKNYVDRREWVGEQSNVYEGWVGGQEKYKICLRSY